MGSPALNLGQHAVTFRLKGLPTRPANAADISHTACRKVGSIRGPGAHSTAKALRMRMLLVSLQPAALLH
jgi:hypothetical protein